MVINNKQNAAKYYVFIKASREEMIASCNNCKMHIKEVLNSIRKLGGQLAYDATTIDLHADGFIVKIAGHHGDIAWHDSTNHMYETCGTVVDAEDIARHEDVDDAVTALLRTPAEYSYVEEPY